MQTNRASASRAFDRGLLGLQLPAENVIGARPGREEIADLNGYAGLTSWRPG